jgi:hypothetical protein
MSFMDAFEKEKSTDVVVSRETTTDTGGKQAVGKTTIGTFKSVFWIGRNAEAVVSEKIRAKVTGVCIFDPGTDVKLHDNLLINGVNYVAFSPDDIGLQEDVLMIPVGGKT